MVWGSKPDLAVLDRLSTRLRIKNSLHLRVMQAVFLAVTRNVTDVRTSLSIWENLATKRLMSRTTERNCSGQECQYRPSCLGTAVAAERKTFFLQDSTASKSSCWRVFSCPFLRTLRAREGVPPYSKLCSTHLRIGADLRVERGETKSELCV